MRCLVKSSNERNPCVLLPARYGGDSGQTAQINWEEGGDDVKSVWPLCLGLHTYYNAQYNVNRDRKVEGNPQNWAQFGLGAATRPHEVGIASNGSSATEP